MERRFSGIVYAFLAELLTGMLLLAAPALAQTQPPPGGYSQQNPNYPTQNQYPNQPPNNPEGRRGDYRDNGAMELPAGTRISIRTDQDITATEASSSYPARVSQDVVGPDGNVLIPQGSPAQLAVLSSKGSLGKEDLGLSLQSVTVNGRTYNVESNITSKGGSGLGANKSTAEHVGGGALLGTLVGAIAGGGKGAAVGAIVGGAGGGAVQVLTGGKKVNVPAETVLTFKTDETIHLR